MGSHDEGSYFR